MNRSNLSDKQCRLKEAYIDTVGVWEEGHAAWLRLNPDSFEAYAAFAAHSWEDNNIDPKDKAIIEVALASCVPYLHRDGVRTYIGAALDRGASVDEVREALELASVIGAHVMVEGIPILQKVTEAETDDLDQPEKAQVREHFKAKRGYWSDLWESILQMDHEYLERFANVSAYPWDQGALDPKVKEFVYVAIDLCTAHLYTDGAEIHLQNAIEHGATPSELLELLELVSTQGYDTMIEGVPILIEEARERNRF